MTNKFPKKLIVIIISICLGFFTLPVFSMSETQIKYCNDKKSIYENNCTYLQQRIEKDVIQNKEDLTAEGEIQEDIDTFATKTKNFACVCLLPLSVISMPISLFGVWGAMFYSIYTNESLKVFR